MQGREVMGDDDFHYQLTMRIKTNFPIGDQQVPRNKMEKRVASTILDACDPKRKGVRIVNTSESTLAGLSIDAVEEGLTP